MLKDYSGNVLARLDRTYVPLVTWDDIKEYPILGHVDSYGNTIYNRAQMRTIQTELQRIQDAFPQLDSDSSEVIEKLKELCSEGMKRPHRFLWFLGD